MPTGESPREGELIFYTTPEGVTKVEVVYQGETFWLSQSGLADLYGVDRSVITKHIGNIFRTHELNEGSVCAKFAHTAADGKNYQSQFYNLDMIIAVGYRVNSLKATQFRIWATQTLRDFIVKGFVLDDERLKLNKRFGPDYFDELLEQIREIPMRMKDWVQKLDAFLSFNEYDILKNPGKVSHELATIMAQEEYEHFRIEQDKDYLSDFEKQAKKISRK